MRRYLFILLFLLVLVAPFFLRRVVVRETDGAEGASGGDTVTLVIVTPHNDDIRREYAHAFSAWHLKTYGRSVKLDYRTAGGSNDIKRQLETTYREIRDRHGGTLPAEEDVHSGLDIVWGGGDFMFDVEIKPTGVLRPVVLDPKTMADAFPQPTLAGVKLYDQSKGKDGKPLPPMWVGVCLSSFGIVYNPDLYRALELPAPKTWSDIAEPKLAGLVALADPAHSGSAAVAYMMVIQRAMADAEIAYFAAHPELKAKPKSEWAKDKGYTAAIASGWKQGLRQLTRIAANARYFTDSATLVPNDVGNGDAATGMAIDFYGRVTQESLGSDRCRFVSPTAATAITPDPIAILYGVTGEKLEAATHFVEFLLSREGQLLWILKPGQPGAPEIRSLRRIPIRPDIYTNRTGWADDLNPFQEAGGFNQRNEWLGTMTDLRPLWVSAWIDDRNALLDAYAAVRRVSNPARRAELLGELVNLPLEMKEVEAITAERKRITAAGGEIDKWKAEERIRWGKKFAEHYRAVGERAGGHR